jgi:hypothetical protein
MRVAMSPIHRDFKEYAEFDRRLRISSFTLLLKPDDAGFLSFLRFQIRLDPSTALRLRSRLNAMAGSMALPTQQTSQSWLSAPAVTSGYSTIARAPS